MSVEEENTIDKKRKINEDTAKSSDMVLGLDSESAYVSLAKRLLQLFNKMIIDGDENSCIKLPLKYIDGIRCSAEIYFDINSIELIIDTDLYKKGSKIEQTRLYDTRIYVNMVGVKLEKIVEILKELYEEHLAKIRYSRLIDGFSLPDQIKRHDMLYNMSNIGFGKCCVCIEACSSSITCGHALCISCLTQMHKYECPICRQEIL